MSINLSTLELPKLAYKFNELDPQISQKTMELHYQRHHQAYITNANIALQEEKIQQDNIIDMLKNISQYSTFMRNNLGGHYNHTLFWAILSPAKANISKNPSDELIKEITKIFFTFNDFKDQFIDAGLKCFGSGWVWLVVMKSQELKICSTPNQDNPLMNVIQKEHQGTPILGLDVWEHAYYLDYQNKRNEYLFSIFDLIDWQEVSRRYSEAIKNNHQI